MPTTTGVYKVAWRERWEGYRESWAQDGVEVTRIADVAWDQRKNFLLDMVGWHTVNGSQIERHPPERDPEFQDLLCVEARLMEGLGVPGKDTSTEALRFERRNPFDTPPTGSPTYGYGRYALTFRTLPYDVGFHGSASSELDRFVEFKQTFSGENLTLPGGSFIWASDNSPIMEPVARVMVMEEHTYTWYAVPSVLAYLPTTLKANIEACLGRTNSVTFNGKAQRTLLSIGADTQRYRSPAGQIVFRVEYKIAHRPEASFDKLFRPSTGIFQRVIRKNNITKSIFEEEDFNKLFRLT